jgi:hypothetical protein
MAKKRKRPRQRPPSAPQAPGRGGANLQRRDRKEEARRLREAERRRARRAASLRRTVTSIGIAIAAVAAITLFRSFGGPNDIPQAAIRAAEQAGCTEVEQPASSAPSGLHLQAEQLPYTYQDGPATSGYHEQSWISEPKVFDSQPTETQAVHSMEHGAVFVYYLPEAEGGIAQDVIERLSQGAQGDQATFLGPYPALTPETALTLTAWNRRQSCPAGDALTPQAASTIVDGFVTAFECTGNAPESSNSPC